MAVTTKKYLGDGKGTTTTFGPLGIELNNPDDLDVYLTPAGAWNKWKADKDKATGAGSSSSDVEGGGTGDYVDNFPRTWCRVPLEICPWKRIDACKPEGLGGISAQLHTADPKYYDYEFYQSMGKACAKNGVTDKTGGTGRYSCVQSGAVWGCSNSNNCTATHTALHRSIVGASKNGVYDAIAGGGTHDMSLIQTLESLAYCPGEAEAKYWAIREDTDLHENNMMNK